MRGAWAAVVADCDGWIAADARSAVALATRGAAHGRLGDLDAAEADCTAAIGLDRRYLAAYLNRAGARARRGAWALVAADCDAVRTSPPRRSAE